jgi:nitroreductase
MNSVIDLLMHRRSVRSYDQKPIPETSRDVILNAAMRAPTAGNLMLYSVIDVQDQMAKDTLVRTCDNQPFIAKAPLVLLFLADYQRTRDYFLSCGVLESCRAAGESVRNPGEGDLMLACCDALIAAQTAVIAAESLGIGSCYIGDILENCETHRELFQLPDYVFPICLVCFGYPKQESPDRPLSSRFARDFIVFRDRYRRLGAAELEEMYRERQKLVNESWNDNPPAPSFGQVLYERKFETAFAREMNRSVREMLKVWTTE